MIYERENGIMGETKKIDYRFCFLYMIGTISVIVGHCECKDIDLLYSVFPPYSFHLPLFLFCSGYFYRNHNADDIKINIWNKVKKLLIPLYLWNLFYALFVLIIQHFVFFSSVTIDLKTYLTGPVFEGNQFLFNLGSWFVFPLFCVQVINVLGCKLLKVIKIEENVWYTFPICVVIGYIGVFTLGKFSNPYIHFTMRHIFTMLPYYTFGRLYRQKLEKMDIIPNFLYFSVIIMVAKLITGLNNGRVPLYAMGPSGIGIGNGKALILSYAISFLAILFWVRVSKILLPIIDNNKLVKVISDNSFSIMVNQFLGFWMVRNIFAIIYKYSEYFDLFDYVKHKNEIYYFYVPDNFDYLYFLYPIAGIAIPILLQLSIDKFRLKVSNCIQLYGCSIINKLP